MKREIKSSPNRLGKSRKPDSSACHSGSSWLNYWWPYSVHCSHRTLYDVHNMWVLNRSFKTQESSCWIIFLWILIYVPRRSYVARRQQEETRQNVTVVWLHLYKYIKLMAASALWEMPQFWMIVSNQLPLSLFPSALRLSCERANRSVSHNSSTQLTNWMNHRLAQGLGGAYARLCDLSHTVTLTLTLTLILNDSHSWFSLVSDSYTRISKENLISSTQT